MHLLAAQPGTVSEGEEAIDLAQTPADVMVLSAADSEIALLANQFSKREAAFSLRLANLMQLKHPMSVDLYLEQSFSKAKLIIARVLGGCSYWTYLVDELSSFARKNNVKLVLLPGDDKPEKALRVASTLADENYEAIWGYFNQSGPENTALLFDFIACLLGKKTQWPPLAKPLLKVGFYWPDIARPTLSEIEGKWGKKQPVALIPFYRSLLEGGNHKPIDALIKELALKGLNALPVFLPSLKDDFARSFLKDIMSQKAIDIILNTTGFATSSYDGSMTDNPFKQADCPVLQVVLASSSMKAWEEDVQGLSSRDLAMHVVLPELDGRVMSRAISFKSAGRFDEKTETTLITYEAVKDRVHYVADLAKNWCRLRAKSCDKRKIAIVLANYPNRDGRLGNGVGYDTPESTVEILKALKKQGYQVTDFPENGTDLMQLFLKGTTNAKTFISEEASLSLSNYRKAFENLPERVQKEVTARWGEPQKDPFFIKGSFHLAVKCFGSIIVGIQPARGYNIDPKESYHDPGLVPPHGYFAFYIWLKQHFRADAIIHNGKHGNHEWLPGKALALSKNCYPEAVMGPIPNIYPFIVNDPGEGTQAKRRTSAIIIDHLTPPLTRAETYGPLKDLEVLVDEYYLASGLDPRRLTLLRRQILDLMADEKLDLDAGISKNDNEDEALMKLDAYLCDLKEAQIRDGLHILGKAPTGNEERDLLVALTRVPRSLGKGQDQSLIRAMAQDFGFTFDPLDCDMTEKWQADKPEILQNTTKVPWRSYGDSVERLELLAQKLVAKEAFPEGMNRTQEVLQAIETAIRPSLKKSGQNEIDNLLKSVSGCFVEAGSSGAPTRGRLDVLPTGRNFFSLDNRTVPTPSAWALGEKSATLLIQRYFQDNGRWPKNLGLSAWGTSNMRTGGDDIAQALALLGVKPKWDAASMRVTGFEILPLALLGRPRVDVTLRVSGFFRDAFPTQMALFDKAVQAVSHMDEEAEENPVAQCRREIISQAVNTNHDTRLKRVFGSKPGAYGAGLQALIDEKIWEEKDDLGKAYIEWGGYAYGEKSKGEEAHEDFKTRLKSFDAIIHNQDNREHDVLDSDDYYQFEGGMSAAVEHLSGRLVQIYHNDHSRPERPVIRTLDEEISRVMRSRLVNPKWIKGVMRHGYKGAFEMAASLDYLFAFAATTGAIKNHHFDLAYEAFIEDQEVFGFLKENNKPALKEMVDRFEEAINRNLWVPKRNSVHDSLKKMREI